MTALGTLNCFAAFALALGPSHHDEPKTDEKPAVVIHCKQEAMIRGAEVLMRDLARIETNDPELTTRIGDIRIGGRPALGFNRVFPRDDLQRRLVVAGLSPKQIKMTGAPEVVAQPLATTLKPSDVTEITDPVLRAVLDLADNDVEFEVLTALKTLRVPPGRFDLSFRAKLRDGRTRPSSAMIDFEIRVDDEVFKVLPVQYRLHHFTHALRTTRVIKKGELLGQQNLELVRIEISPGSNMHLTSFDLVQGMVAARDIQNDHSLQLAEVSKPAVVHRKDLVTLVSKRGRIQVTTKAIALEAGAIGSRVQVRTLTNNKPVQAIVRGAGLVVIP